MALEQSLFDRLIMDKSSLKKTEFYAINELAGEDILELNGEPVEGLGIQESQEDWVSWVNQVSADQKKTFDALPDTGIIISENVIGE